MTKDEILQKSRAQKEDEGVIYMQNKGYSFGIVGLSILFFALAIIYLFVGGHNLNVPFAMMCGYQGSENIGRFVAGREAKNLVWGIVLSILSLTFLAAYLFIDVLGVIVF